MTLSTQLGLPAASALASFVLRTAVQWLAVMALARTAISARVRARLWFGMLVLFAGQWVWLLAATARGIVSSLHLAQAAAGGTSGAGASRGGIAISLGAASNVAWTVGVLLALYCAGIVWQLVSTGWLRIQLQRALRHRRAPARRLIEAFEQMCIGRDVCCELWVLPGLASPATRGWLRRQVLLPPSCETQDEAELEAVFWHELKHVERRDALENGVARLCRSLVWFHPGAHHALRGLAVERELACDAEVIAEHPEKRDVYATCLVRFARAVDLAAASGIAAVEMASRATQLSLRVRSILTPRPRACVALRSARVLGCGAIAAATLWALPSLGISLRTDAALSPQTRIELPIVPRPISHARRGVVTTRADTRASRASIGLTSPVPPTPHDEALAAQHRVALGVLTESTGLEAQPEGADVTPAAAMRMPDHAGGGSGALSVAVDAAEHMAPLLADHDGDDRR